MAKKTRSRREVGRRGRLEFRSGRRMYSQPGPRLPPEDPPCVVVIIVEVAEVRWVVRLFFFQTTEEATESGKKTGKQMVKPLRSVPGKKR